MRLGAELAAVLVGCTATILADANLYLIPARDAQSPVPTLSPNLAGFILQQRLTPAELGPSSRDVPADVKIEDLLVYLDKFGKASPSLFTATHHAEPKQLLVLLEEIISDQAEALNTALQMQPAFSIGNHSNHSTREPKATRLDLQAWISEISNGDGCTFEQAVQIDHSCWKGKETLVLRYNIAKDQAILEEVPVTLTQQLPSFRPYELEISILTTTLGSKYIDDWFGSHQELRRRQAERVITPGDKSGTPASSDSSSASKETPISSAGPLPTCFNSKDRCVSATRNCSSHGVCENKYPNQEGSKQREPCYACRCLSTRRESGGLTHWAGPVCAKQDISVAFWLFAGFTLALVGILSLAIMMLFNVGQEKLPGVIGAGVSRSK